MDAGIDSIQPGGDMLQKDLAALVENQGVGLPVKEPNLQLGFQTADGAAQGGLGDIELMGGLTDILTFCHRDELMKLGQIQGYSPLSCTFDFILTHFRPGCKAGRYVLTGISDCTNGIGNGNIPDI